MVRPFHRVRAPARSNASVSRGSCGREASIRSSGHAPGRHRVPAPARRHHRATPQVARLGRGRRAHSARCRAGVDWKQGGDRDVRARSATSRGSPRGSATPTTRTRAGRCAPPPWPSLDRGATPRAPRAPPGGRPVQRGPARTSIATGKRQHGPPTTDDEPAARDGPGHRERVARRREAPVRPVPKKKAATRQRALRGSRSPTAASSSWPARASTSYRHGLPEQPRRGARADQPDVPANRAKLDQQPGRASLARAR